MSDTEFDVVIAAYLIPDLAQKDFDALVTLVTGKQLKVLTPTDPGPSFSGPVVAGGFLYWLSGSTLNAWSLP